MNDWEEAAGVVLPAVRRDDLGADAGEEVGTPAWGLDVDERPGQPAAPAINGGGR